jgi:hypothetical protein
MRPIDATRDIFDVLLRDHRDLQALCWDLEWVAERGDTTSAARLLGELAIGLVEHAHVEEHLLCRRVEGSDDQLDEQIRRARVGHRGVETALMELSGLSISDPAWRTELIGLRDLIADHIDAEERELFVRACHELAPGEALVRGRRATALLADETAIDAADDEVIELGDDDLEELVEYEAPVAVHA